MGFAETCTQLQVEVAVEITMETTTSVQRPEKSAIISAQPLISRVLLPGLSESTSSMTYKHQETGKGVCLWSTM